MIIIWNEPCFATFGRGDAAFDFKPGSNDIPDSIAVKLAEEQDFKDAVRKKKITIVKAAVEPKGKQSEDDENPADPWADLDKEQALEYVENLIDLPLLERVLVADNLPKGGAAAIKKAAKARIAEIKAHLKSKNDEDGDNDDE